MADCISQLRAAVSRMSELAYLQVASSFGSLIRNIPKLTGFLVALALSQTGISLSLGAEEAGIELKEPISWQVVQRQGFTPAQAHVNHVGGPALGFADVRVRGKYALGNATTWEYRVVPWKQKSDVEATWTKFDVLQNADQWEGTIRIAGGGWYRLEIRALSEGRTVSVSHVEPFGVGEVFVIAGQSYAAGANDELLKVEDPEQRVSAFDVTTGTWQVANDPQPIVGDGGTIWPPLGDILVPLVRVPVGFVNVAEGGTASREWLPGVRLYKRLSDAGKTIGQFRAVLWQQGESDVIEKVPTKIYVERLSTIRQELARAWGFAPTWLLAKSTLHPTVYIDPDHEGQIRSAIEHLCTLPGFRPGPDTDILGGSNRGALGSRRHFTGIGQRRAAWLWFAAIWQELNHPRGEKLTSERGTSGESAVGSRKTSEARP